MSNQFIEKDSIMPRYAQLINILQKWIGDKYNVGDKIPSERELTRMFKVSRSTVVRAIRELEYQKLLYSDHGRGTFVTASIGVGNSNSSARKKVMIKVVIPFSVILGEHAMDDVFVHKSEYQGIKHSCAEEKINLSVHDAVGLGNGAHLVGELKGAAAIFVGNYNKIVQKMVLKLRSQGTPWCGVGANLEKVFSENCIFADLHNGAMLALEHCLRLGYKKIGYCCQTGIMSDARMLAFKKFIPRKLIQAHEFLPVNLALGASPLQIKQCAYQAAKARIEKGGLPRAYFCQNDFFALGVLEAAKEKGLRVPADLAIVGFDNRPESRESVPALTTVQTPLEEMGRKAALQMKRCLENGVLSFPSIKFSCKIIVRDSCGGNH